MPTNSSKVPRLSPGASVAICFIWLMAACIVTLLLMFSMGVIGADDNALKALASSDGDTLVVLHILPLLVALGATYAVAQND